MGKWNSNILAVLLKHNTQVNKDRAIKNKNASARMKEAADRAVKYLIKKGNVKE